MNIQGKRTLDLPKVFLKKYIARSETLNYKVELPLNKNDSVVLHFSSEGLGVCSFAQIFHGDQGRRIIEM